MSVEGHENPTFSEDISEVPPLKTPECLQCSRNSTHTEIQPDEDPQPRTDIIYNIEDKPPWYTSCLLGMQHYMTMVGATLTIPFILAPVLCIAPEDPANGKLVSTILFVSGISTLLQTTLGIRLPIVQGGTFAFLVPTLTIIRSSFPKCESIDYSNMSATQIEEQWTERMNVIQGSIIVASLFQVFVGVSGLAGLLLSFITPLTIVPTISLIGFALFKQAADSAAGNWGIAFMAFFLLILFSQYLANFKVPIPIFSKNQTEKKFKGVQIFKLFPVILALTISWAICAILTISGALTQDSPARTDTRFSLVDKSPWFYVPYPFQWGIPRVTLSGTLGMLAGVIASIIESIGDYYACARLSDVPSPPKHAVNRGIAIEGLGCVIAGIIGSGNGTTSYSENIGAIRITKVASRRIVQIGALIMIAFAVFGKFGAMFITLPSPVMGGIYLVIFGIISAVGLSNLKFVDLDSSRNICILGVSMFCGIAIPEWMIRNPDAINTKWPNFNQVITVLLSTHMLIGGSLGLILDNTIPGTDKERGLLSWQNQNNDSNADKVLTMRSYDLPFGMEFIKRHPIFARVPISPTYAYRKIKNTQLEGIKTKLKLKLGMKPSEETAGL